MDDGRIGEVSKEYVDQLQIKTPSLNQLVKFLSGETNRRLSWHVGSVRGRRSLFSMSQPAN